MLFSESMFSAPGLLPSPCCSEGRMRYSDKDANTPAALERENAQLDAPAMRDKNHLLPLYDTDEIRHRLRLEVLMGCTPAHCLHSCNLLIRLMFVLSQACSLRICRICTGARASGSRLGRIWRRRCNRKRPRRALREDFC